MQYEQCTLDEVAEAISYLDAGTDRDSWAVIGMAVKSEFGDLGRDVFEDWSMTSDKYNKSNFKSAWRSFKQSGGVTIKTLFKQAMDKGYKPAKKEWSDAEKKKRQTEYEERRALREKEAIEEQRRLSELQLNIATASQTVWDNLKQAGTSEYLKEKQVDAFGGRFVSKQFMFVVDLVKNTAYVLVDRPEMNGVVKLKKQDEHAVSFLWLKRGTFVLPMFDMTGKLWSLQFIMPSGKKLFIKHCKKQGTCFLLNKNSRLEAPVPIMLAEGFATGASIHMATGYPVFVCWDSGNLVVMSSLIRQAYPDFKLLICGDNDHSTKNNPGLTKAKKAAVAANCDFVVPTFNQLMADIKEAANG